MIMTIIIIEETESSWEKNTNYHSRKHIIVERQERLFENGHYFLGFFRRQQYPQVGSFGVGLPHQQHRIQQSDEVDFFAPVFKRQQDLDLLLVRVIVVVLIVFQSIVLVITLFQLSDQGERLGSPLERQFLFEFFLDNVLGDRKDVVHEFVAELDRQQVFSLEIAEGNAVIARNPDRVFEAVHRDDGVRVALDETVFVSIEEGNRNALVFLGDSCQSSLSLGAQGRRRRRATMMVRRRSWLRPKSLRLQLQRPGRKGVARRHEKASRGDDRQ
mmetsp:Transcript_16886/g.46391  ORF Transcript_16886/g.46391 Transcript_16886/m.46391 type:complete len:272 (+) Transcript_16886:34-849(+)